MVRVCSRRCALSILTTIAMATWAADAWAAQSAVSIHGNGLSVEFVIASIGSLVGALITGYIRGVDQHLKRVETKSEARAGALEVEFRQQQTQINLLREKFHEEHPSRRETDQHRLAVEKSLADLQKSYDRIDGRLDAILRAAASLPAHIHRRHDDDGLSG